MKKLTTLFLAAVMLLTLLAGCGGAAPQTAAPAMKGDYAMNEMAVEEPAAMEDGAMMNTSAGSGANTALPASRKWIITVRMEAETEDLDGMLEGLNERIAAMNGYVEDQEIFNGSSYSSRRHRNAHLTIRIPAEDVDAFTNTVSGMSNVISNNLSREDITLTYTATESKITALKTEETRLLELLAQAENMSDLLEIEARLSDVRYELERYSSQLRLYDNQVDYATIYLSISEVQEYTPVVEKTVWERIRDGFSDSLEGLGEDLVDIAVWFIVSSPYLVVWAVVLGVIFFTVKKLRKGRRIGKVKNVPTPAPEPQKPAEE